MSRLGRRLDIQGIRAVAVLAVVAFHAGLPLPGGFVGVDVFFVVSGFVITAMLDREWQASGRVKFGNFYMRRFKRLTPALALMTAVTMVVSVAVLSPLGPQQTAAKTAVGAVFLVANFAIARSTGGYFDAAAEVNPLLHTWSLSVEEQFYLIFPAVVVTGWVLARRRLLALSPFVAVSSIALLSFALAVAGSAGAVPGMGILTGFYSPFTRAWEFAAGALLALALTRALSLSRHLLAVLGVMGLAMVAMSVMIITERTPFPGVWTLLPVTGTVLLLLAGTDACTPTSRMLSCGPMTRIGDLSYSIYLWHWPFIVFAGLLWQRSTAVLLGAALMSFLAAVISYEWVEKPIRDLGGLTPHRWAAVVAAVLVPPLLLGGGLWFSAANGWWSTSVRRLQAATIPLHLAHNTGCGERRALGVGQHDRCTWNPEATGDPIYLLGDSNADQFSEGFVRAGTDLNRPVIIAAPWSCPFIDVALWSTRATPAANDDCRRTIDGDLAYLKHAKGGLVVIGNSHEYWEREPEYQAGPSMDQLSGAPSRKLAAFKAGLRHTVETLLRDGHQVLLIQAVPNWDHPHWDPSRCSLPTIIRGGCKVEMTRDDATTDYTALRSALAEVAQATGVEVWDPLQLLCPDETCSTEAPTFTRYRDGDHISVTQSIELAADIRAMIATTQQSSLSAP